MKNAMRTLAVVIAGAVGAAACGGGPGPGAGEDALTRAVASAQADAQAMLPAGSPSERVGSLPSQSLEPGQCGVFLFGNVTGRVELIFFASAAQGGGRMRLDGDVRGLSPAAGIASRVGDASLRQIFESAEARVTVEIDVERGEPVAGGERIPAGVLRMRDEGGWSVVIPVAGMAACAQQGPV